MSIPSILESEQPARQPKISVLGFDIPISPSGRRQRPAKFKIEIQRKLAVKEMTSRQVAEACGVSTKTVYKWKRFPPRNPGRPRSTRLQTKPEEFAEFAELRVSEALASKQPDNASIILRFGATDLELPEYSPVDQLVRLIRALEVRT